MSIINFDSPYGKIELDTDKKEVYFSYQDYLDDASVFREVYTFQDMYGKEFRAQKIGRERIGKDERYWILEECSWRRLT